MKNYIARFAHWVSKRKITHSNDIKNNQCTIDSPVKQLMSIAPKILDGYTSRGVNNSMIVSRMALLDHGPAINKMASIISNCPNINALLAKEKIKYRFYILDKMHNYFTCVRKDDIVEVYLSKTFNL